MISAGPKDTINSATLGPFCISEENKGSGVSKVTQLNQTVTSVKLQLGTVSSFPRVSV